MVKKFVMPFTPEMTEAVIEGKKFCTSRRTKKCNERDVFVLDGNVFVVYKIEQRTLDNVANQLYRNEGFDNPDGFINIWRKLHPKMGFVPNQIVFVHWFTKLVHRV